MDIIDIIYCALIIVIIIFLIIFFVYLNKAIKKLNILNTKINKTKDTIQLINIQKENIEKNTRGILIPKLLLTYKSLKHLYNDLKKSNKKTSTIMKDVIKTSPKIIKTFK